MFPELRAAFPRRVLNPVVSVLAKLGVTPNTVSWLGLLLSVLAAVLAGGGQLAWAGWVSLIGGALDMLDGSLARATGQATRFGALLDSTLDRYGEAVLLVGVAAYYATSPEGGPAAIAAAAALVGSFMVSYVKARAEGLGVSCDIGFLTRPERVVVLGVGLVTGLVLPALVLVAVAANFTAFQRLYHVWRTMEER